MLFLQSRDNFFYIELACGEGVRMLTTGGGRSVTSSNYSKQRLAESFNFSQTDDAQQTSAPQTIANRSQIFDQMKTIIFFKKSTQTIFCIIVCVLRSRATPERRKEPIFSWEKKVGYFSVIYILPPNELSFNLMILLETSMVAMLSSAEYDISIPRTIHIFVLPSPAISVQGHIFIQVSFLHSPSYPFIPGVSWSSAIFFVWVSSEISKVT